MTSFFKLLLLPVSACLILVMSGCELTEKAKEDMYDFVEDGKPHYVITVNSIVKYPRAEKLEQKIPTFDGRTIWINTNPFIHSRNIRQVEMVPMPHNPGFYNLQVKLNRRGKLLWMQLAASFKHKPVACVIDGVFFRSFYPKHMVDEKHGLVIIPGPFDKFTATAIKNYAKSNYEIFNPENKWF